MPKKASNTPLARTAEPLFREICFVLEQARAGAYRAVNAAMVQAYWHVGRLIVEHEQGGRRRATYGEALLEELSRRLMAEFDRASMSPICARCGSFTGCSTFETRCLSNRSRQATLENETQRVSIPGGRQFATSRMAN